MYPYSELIVLLDKRRLAYLPWMEKISFRMTSIILREQAWLLAPHRIDQDRIAGRIQTYISCFSTSDISEITATYTE